MPSWTRRLSSRTNSESKCSQHSISPTTDFCTSVSGFQETSCPSRWDRSRIRRSARRRRHVACRNPWRVREAAVGTVVLLFEIALGAAVSAHAQDHLVALDGQQPLVADDGAVGVESQVVQIFARIQAPSSPSRGRPLAPDRMTVPISSNFPEAVGLAAALPDGFSFDTLRQHSARGSVTHHAPGPPSTACSAWRACSRSHMWARSRS